MSEIKQKQEFLTNLKLETKSYWRFEDVYFKAERDGYLDKIYATLNEIFREEFRFVALELQKSLKLNQNSPISNLLKSNFVIFKENLKLILSSSGALMSGSNLPKLHKKIRKRARNV